MDSIKSNEDVSNVDVISAKDLLSSGHTYLDVRTVEEYNRGHIDKAINIPYMFLNEQGRVKNPDFLEQVSSVCQKEDHLIVGYKDVRNLEGGYSAWVDNEFKGDEAAQQFKTACKFRP
ncbi:hypothetical protein MTR67_029034 [Solanum verrucosum]|uniref:Rhodanese domain-containing protein n=1 Tax=Solanum verrucosum TaxID=315347 RepID=A0AAF0TX79_SOLVR|nr:hypothetical protein MTR67_029034 [Solanum verrucosum]